MSLITSMRKQNAIYWPPAQVDDYGRPAVGGDFVELVLDADTGVNYRVRWEDVIEEFIDFQGTTRQSTAKVYVPQLPDGTEIVPGGWIFLGGRYDLVDETDAQANPAARQVRRADQLPNLKASEKLRTVYL